VVPAGELAEQAAAFARQLAAGPTRAYAITKRLLAESEHVSFDGLLQLEAEAQVEAGATSDHRGAVQSFLAKQPAKFEGR
jgi:2-(1,2-epoxy-1,2-dihydrophenyl)acetyl-CoA isomerase